MSTARETLVQLQTELTQIREKMVATARILFAEDIQQIFTDNPTLESFSWRQYTPFFNDGESCEFSAHTDSITVVLSENSESDEDEDEDKEIWVYGKLDADASPKTVIAYKINKVLRTLDDDTLLSLFGDHVEVTVYRDGKIEQENYDHD